MTDPRTLSLSLVSHTNAGKTTLARTLLGRDVGTVRDAPHVTEFADVFTLQEADGGARLLLWDTPGFGDSLRLVRRLRASATPLGWFMSQVWDRFRDRPFWASQQAMKNVRDEADVMLYLVNAAESPESAGYVQPEMELLGWLGKPVVVLLNQLGAPRGGEAEGGGEVDGAEVTRWRRHLAGHAHVKAVLPLDAFARCWVQEFTLLEAIEAVLQGEPRALMARLRAAWQQRRWHTFEASVESLAASLARLASDAEPVPEAAGLKARLRAAGSAIGLGIGIGDAQQAPAALAQKALGARLDAEVRANTLELIALHGLEGRAQGEILTRLAAHFDTRFAVDEVKAGLWGGMVSGALVGLKADVLSGGLTLGGGMLAGGLIGALGGAGLARAVNLVRGNERSWVRWNAEALGPMLEAALLRYLAVAHFGRGRGEWSQGESPPHWLAVVRQSLAPHREALATLWGGRDPGGEGDDAGAEGGNAGAEADRMRAALEPIVGAALRSVLRSLYPGAVGAGPVDDAAVAPGAAREEAVRGDPSGEAPAPASESATAPASAHASALAPHRLPAPKPLPLPGESSQSLAPPPQ